jgi:hypothetical protein
MRDRHPNGVGQLGGQPVVAESADETDNSGRHKSSGFGQIMCDVFTNPIRSLVQATAEADEIS